MSNDELVSIYLLSDTQVQSEVAAGAELVQNSLSTRIMSFLDYLRITTQANRLVTALNTNFLIITMYTSNYKNIHVASRQVSYTPSSYGRNSTQLLYCGVDNPVDVVTFSDTSLEGDADLLDDWNTDYPGAEEVDGFFTGCTPLEALLQSTLDCLYEVQCLQLISKNFPAVR